MAHLQLAPAGGAALPPPPPPQPPARDSVAGLSLEQAVEVHMVNIQTQLNGVPEFAALNDDIKWHIWRLVEPVMRDLVFSLRGVDDQLTRAVIQLSACARDPTTFINTKSREYQELFEITQGKWSRKAARLKKDRLANQYARVAKLGEEIEAKKKDLQTEKMLLHILQVLHAQQQGDQREEQQREVLAERLQQQFLAYQDQMKGVIRGVRDGSVRAPQLHLTGGYAAPSPPAQREKRRPIQADVYEAPAAVRALPAPLVAKPPTKVNKFVEVMEIDEEEEDDVWTDEDEIVEKMKKM